MSASASAFFSPTPFSSVTGILASWAKRLPPLTSPQPLQTFWFAPHVPVWDPRFEIWRGFWPSLDGDEVRVQRLAAVVDLDVGVGAVLGQPLGDPAGVGRGRSLSLDHGDD